MFIVYLQHKYFYGTRVAVIKPDLKLIVDYKWRTLS